MKRETPILRIDQLTKTFNQQCLFEGLDLSVYSGEWVGIVGKNGAGKSTLAKIICGLETSQEGTIFFKGRAKQTFTKREWVKHVQLITQYSRNALDPTKTIYAILCEPIRRFAIFSVKEELENIQALVVDCGLSGDILSKYPSQISGGQYQRVCVALALVVEPEILICDEVTANLDRITELRIIKLLKRKKRGIIFISHDHSLVNKHCDRFINLE